MTARALFWGSVCLLAYTYVVFPLIVVLRSRAVPARAPASTERFTPSVTIIIAAHNEAQTIGRKLTSLRALLYPSHLLQIIVASDGSTDGTPEAVREFGREAVIRVLDLPRVGKAAALNAAAREADGQVLVFTDANSIFEPDTLRNLVRRLADPSVGGVAGDQRYIGDSRADGTAAGEYVYWGLDRLIKMFESSAGSTISATGALYAIRRELFQPVPEGVTDDFVVSTRVISAGYRLVFASDAVVWEPVAATRHAEFHRKVRVMTRGLRGVLVMRELLNVRRFGFYSVQLLSHKVLRRLMVIPLLLLAVTAPLLWSRGRLYRLATVGQLGGYLLGGIGVALAGHPLGKRRLFSVPAYFCLVNAAAAAALVNVALGRRIAHWNPARGADPQAESIDARASDAVRRMRGDSGAAPDITVVIPVNARGDLSNAWTLLDDLSRYQGQLTVELLFVVNNFDAERPPALVTELRDAGARVIAIPNLSVRPGDAVPWSARLPGLREARSERVVLFDADIRIPDPTALIDWYAFRLSRGAGVAYTRVGFHSIRPRAAVWAKLATHHAARWTKRVVLRIPTTRGSNYAVRRSLVLALYAAGTIADDLNVGPSVKAAGFPVTYCGRRRLQVLTSARMFRAGWRRLIPYFWYRLRYNIRMLPVRPDAAGRSGRQADPDDRFDYSAGELSDRER
jgi:cellulose synthase/poly-beta-1,6-N-acetylglucosamine synthase-like glycosyltransferase